jgi:hypothetical protein
MKLRPWYILTLAALPVLAICVVVSLWGWAST